MGVELKWDGSLSRKQETVQLFNLILDKKNFFWFCLWNKCEKIMSERVKKEEVSKRSDLCDEPFLHFLNTTLLVCVRVWQKEFLLSLVLHSLNICIFSETLNTFFIIFRFQFIAVNPVPFTQIIYTSGSTEHWREPNPSPSLERTKCCINKIKQTK